MTVLWWAILSSIVIQFDSQFSKFYTFGSIPTLKYVKMSEGLIYTSCYVA